MIQRVLALSILAGLLTAHVALADTLVGRVVGVIDGDTVDVLVDGRDKYRIRVAGIDAPEKGQAFGQAAKRHMSDLIRGRDAQVEFTKRDRYARIVGVVRLEGRDAGLALIQSGLAWHYVKYMSEQSPSDRESYASSESVARRARIGLWSDGTPIPPWDWRRKSK